MTLYRPTDHAEGLASYTQDGFSEAAYLHDNLTQCSCCNQWFTDDGKDFDEVIYRDRGEWVCDVCAPGYREEALCDPAREHGTYWAARGSVVG